VLLFVVDFSSCCSPAGLVPLCSLACCSLGVTWTKVPETSGFVVTAEVECAWGLCEAGFSVGDGPGEASSDELIETFSASTLITGSTPRVVLPGRALFFFFCFTAIFLPRATCRPLSFSAAPLAASSWSNAPSARGPVLILICARSANWRLISRLNFSQCSCAW